MNADCRVFLIYEQTIAKDSKTKILETWILSELASQKSQVVYFEGIEIKNYVTTSDVSETPVRNSATLYQRWIRGLGLCCSPTSCEVDLLSIRWWRTISQNTRCRVCRVGLEFRGKETVMDKDGVIRKRRFIR